MDKQQKIEFEKEYYDLSEFREFLYRLHEKTVSLFNEVGSSGSENIKLKELRTAEVFSLYTSAKVFASIKEFQHYEFTSLFSFWEQFYHELVEILEVDDSNHSWASSRFSNYEGQYEIVDTMLKDQSDFYKEKLGY